MVGSLLFREFAEIMAAFFAHYPLFFPYKKCYTISYILKNEKVCPKPVRYRAEG